MVNSLPSSLRSLENYLCELLVVSLWTQTPSASPSVSCSEKPHLNLTLAKAVQFYNKLSTAHKEIVLPLFLFYYKMARLGPTAASTHACL